MQDFIRIGGPVTSSPLNENFRRLLNAISIANTNLAFSEEHGIVDTIADMEALVNTTELIDGQVCYVVSSGELYRWSAGQQKWIKIMDIGQTFRQGFLNSGLVIMEGEMTADGNDIIIPPVLLYFKNQEGDGRYLRGMYKIESARLLVNTAVNGAFSILMNSAGELKTISGLIAEDDVNWIFLGSFIIANNQLFNVYTLPDIAYTADRGHFFIDGGQAEGLVLKGNGDDYLSRDAGYYYDEGANYVNDDISKYADIVNEKTNLNLKHFNAEPQISLLYYIYPDHAFSHNITIRDDGRLDVSYINGGAVTAVPQGFFTIQRHLITPKGENFFIYDDKYYNSIADALEHLNDPFGLDVEFPYVESCRLIIGAKTVEEVGGVTIAHTDTDDNDWFQVKTLSRLSQVGTFTPEFADDSFKLYSGETDITPATMQFNLHNLELEDYHYDDSYQLYPLSYGYTKENFALAQKYVDIGQPATSVTQRETGQYRTVGNTKGYEMASNMDVAKLRERIETIEKEIWQVEQSGVALYNQSLRFRMSKNTNDITTLRTDVNNKVDKTFKINNKSLNDPSGEIILYTDDINENNNPIHLWTSAGEKTNWNTAYDHATKRGTGSVTNNNPHGLGTADLTENGNKYFVSQTEHQAIENLPPNTTQALNGKTGPIPVFAIDEHGVPVRLTNPLNENGLYIYENGANITSGPDGTVYLECVGQFNADNVLTYDDFATLAKHGGIYAGKVDHAVKADGIDFNRTDPMLYYGTNAVGTPGIFELPVYVSTANAEEYQDVNQSYFLPIDKSVCLAHLGNSKVTYPARSEEAKTGTNVYELVTKHYHKVYNSGVQGPYIDGTQTQDTSKIYYEYKIPAGGLEADDYYFSYENHNYRFTLNNDATAGQILRYAPYTDILTLDGAILQKDPVAAEIVDENMWLPLVSVTNWNNINEWNFGDNLTVTVNEGRATINASVAGYGVSNFVNLADVYLEYNDDNLGKMPVLDKDPNGVYRLVWGVSNMKNVMRSQDYVGPNATLQVHSADLADSATTANTLQNLYSVNDGTTSASALWTSSKIVQEINKGVKVYSGTSTPTSSIGKDGDLYILLNE